MTHLLVGRRGPQNPYPAVERSYSITRRLQAGARVSGGVPIGDGDHRVVGAARVVWLEGRFTTAAELQAGIAGDPFTVRGVVSTAMTF